MRPRGGFLRKGTRTKTELFTDLIGGEKKILDIVAQAQWEHGLSQVGKPYVKYLERGLWEIRLKGQDGISRALYVTAKPQRVVIVRVFIKKTQKTPRKEIKLALKRAEELKS